MLSEWMKIFRNLFMYIHVIGIYPQADELIGIWAIFHTLRMVIQILYFENTMHRHL